MIQDTQEYLQVWEKENNPFYPSEMRWDRLKVNIFLKDYKKQLIIPVVSKNEVEYCDCPQPHTVSTTNGGTKCAFCGKWIFKQ